jgi:sugar/nucleoside kinase (ribokinase family)
MKEIVSIGEILIDFAPTNAERGGGTLYCGNPGGSTANLACACAKFGHDTAFIGKVGDDNFGRQCIAAVAGSGADAERIVVSGEYPTTLAFVTLDHGGNRSFSFYRAQTADSSLSVRDIEVTGIPAAKFFHFGGISLSVLPSRDAVFHAVRQAKLSGSVISYDPNLRLDVWQTPEEAKRVTMEAIGLADIIKISLEEGEFLFGETEPAKLCGLIERRFSPQMVLVTLGTDGCAASVGGKRYTSYAYDVAVTDTTGAGDCFHGGILHCLLEYAKLPSELTADEVLRMLAFANAAGSLVTTKPGAIPAIPTLAEIESCIAGVPRLTPAAKKFLWKTEKNA